jgi:spore maturation protein SpmB
VGALLERIEKKTMEPRITATDALRAGMEKGGRGFVWLLKILVPISFLTFVLDYSGWLGRLDFVLAPAMALLHLPPEAALVLIIGMLTGIYGAVAVMAVLPLTQGQMTLIAVFLLISHGLVQEGVVQGKSGYHPVKATLVRLAASVITVQVVALFLDPATLTAVGGGVPATAERLFLPLLAQWGIQTLILAAKIFFIVMALMTALELMKTFGLIDRVVFHLRPLLRAMGLDPSAGILWLAAALFGLAYGGAVIVEETRNGALTREALDRLHISIGINHAMVEDPALFLALGIGAFWLWVPRLVAAVAAVHLYGLWCRLAHPVPSPSTDATGRRGPL